MLMEVMELREGLEDASSEEEAAEVRERNKGERKVGAPARGLLTISALQST